ncbi:RNA-binding protein 41-like [Patiria miniata]|uniref:RRM domain-containing protein n=1 Tax=Patiria miniata TaxID=46514 RepID=A0A913Z477_PATMI|nr:RNA-binding protein 41-like [Patiria miniata]XP_038045802.1 RNA-binding protein 41-like [Patiria miniata]
MGDDPYEDDSNDPSQPLHHPATPSEAELQVQRMLGEQLHTDISIEQQVSKSRSFTPATSTFRPFVERASGQLSLEEFQALEKEHQELEELRACGLNDQEIAFKLEHEGRQLSNLLYPHKRGHFLADPATRQKRLKIVEDKIQRRNTQLNSSQDATSSSSDNQQMTDDSQGGSAFSSQHQTLLGKKFVHPDDPINHLDAIAAGLFGKTNEDKQLGNVSPRRGNTTSLMGEPTRGCSPGCRDDGPHPTEEGGVINECTSKEKSVGIFREGLRAECTSESVGEESVTGHATHIGQARHLTKQGVSLEGAPKEGITNCATGGLETREKSRLVPGVEGECIGGQGEDNEPRRLIDVIRPLSREDLLLHRLSQDDICRMERFANYSPGQPSKVLYLKNLSSKVTEADLASLFISFQHPDKPKILFKLLKGKMRGQAFVTFADTETAADAMAHANGYPLKGKPVIIQYGKNR